MDTRPTPPPWRIDAERAHAQARRQARLLALTGHRGFLRPDPDGHWLTSLTETQPEAEERTMDAPSAISMETREVQCGVCGDVQAFPRVVAPSGRGYLLANACGNCDSRDWVAADDETAIDPDTASVEDVLFLMRAARRLRWRQARPDVSHE